MIVAEGHPSVAELDAFILGKLDEAVSSVVEEHLTGCPACQERAAQVSGDTFVDLLRCAQARTAPRTDTVAEPAGQGSTPGPVADAAYAETLPPRVAPAGSSGSDCTEGLDAVPPELAGHMRYRIVRVLGQGGMGIVYQAEHRVMQRPVAVKVINRAYTANSAAVERFRREVRAAARLAHPNIVTTHDAEDAGETLFLVMEYVEGVSLGRLVKERGPLPVAEACEYVRQAALGLQHAHERGMVHRDVKPDNLIRCADDPVKVLDFGLAVLTAERGAGFTETDVIMGTPDFMAPEQAEDARGADIRADVYSLGCTLYFLLTGSVPYPAPTALLKILAHREQPVPSLRKVRPEVAPELAGVVARMLAKKPADRYQTPAEVVAALEPFTRTGRQEHKKTGRRRGWLVAAAVLFFGLVAAGTAVYRVQTDKGELVITTESDDVKVVIKQGGKQIDIIDAKTDKQITLGLRSGVYELELKGAPEGLKLNIDKATLTRGETVLAKITRGEKGSDVAVKPPEEKVGRPAVSRKQAKAAALACVSRGYFLLNQGQEDKALAEFNEAIRLDPTLAVAYVNRGYIASQKGEPDKAFRDYAEALRLDPYDTNVLCRRARLHFERGNSTLAIADCSAALAIAPKHAEAWFLRGFYYLRTEDFDRAIADSTQAIQIDGTIVDAYFNRGFAWFKKSNLDKALADYDAALKLNPDYARVYEYRAKVHASKGDRARASADEKRAKQLHRVEKPPEK